MSTGTRSDFGAARQPEGRPGHREGPAERRDPGADRIATLAALVEGITAELDAIEGAARRSTARRDPVRPNPGPASGPPDEAAARHDRLAEIEARLAAIAGQMAAATPGEPLPRKPAPRRAARTNPELPAASQAEAWPAELWSAIAEIAARQKALDEAGEAAAPGSTALEDQIDALRGDIATLARRIGSEARRSEEMDRALRAEIAARLDAAPREDGARFDELRRHLQEIRQAIGASARETTLASIEAGYSHVIERLDEITRRVPERGRVDLLAEEIGRLGDLIERVQPFRAMEGELEDIRNQIATFAAARVSESHLERQLAELRRVVERLADAPRETVDLSPLHDELAAIRRDVDALAENSDPLPLRRLEQQVAAVHGMMERLAQGIAQGIAAGGAATLSRIEGRIDALSGRFDALADLPALQGQSGAGEASEAAIEGLRGEVAALRGHVEQREPLRFDQIDRQMQRLMERLDAAAERDDGRSLAALEAEVAGLAERVVAAAPAGDALGRVETEVGRLQSLIGEARSETIEAARGIVRDSLAEWAGRLPSPPDEALIGALREDLRTLQAAALSTDRRNQDALETVRETLARLVERIARMERTEPETALPEMPRAQPVAASLLAELPEDDRPLPPGSGRPDLSLRSDEPVAASPPSPGMSPRAADRKADFIAAARRAAQAAQAEADRARAAERSAPPVHGTTADDDPDGEGEARRGPLARIGTLFGRRRRSVALAIAAVLFAIGAAKYGQPLAESLVAATTGGGLDPIETGSSTPAALVGPQSLLTPPRASAAASSGAGAGLARPALVAPDPDGLASGGPLAPAAPTGGFARQGPVPTADAARASVPLDLQAVERDAAAGDAVAAFELAKAYGEGDGVGRDAALAASWFVRSAGAGLAVAQYRAGSLYERGEGVPRDLAVAETWYRKASAQGNVRAAHNLGVLLGEGAAAAPDYAAAATFFRIAAERGLADSQYNLGVLHARGLGVTADLVQSCIWFALAAAQGDAEAARRRDDVAKALPVGDLAGARAAVQAFRLTPQDPAANLEPVPKVDWLRTASVSLAGSDRGSASG